MNDNDKNEDYDIGYRDGYDDATQARADEVYQNIEGYWRCVLCDYRKDGSCDEDNQDSCKDFTWHGKKQSVNVQ